MILFEILLAVLFAVTAAWLDSENRRTNRINVGLALQLDAERKANERLAASADTLRKDWQKLFEENEELKSEYQSSLETCVELQSELDEWHREAFERDQALGAAVNARLN